MKNKGTLYVGVMLILFGGLFLFTETAGVLFAHLGLHVGWGTLWPFIILLAGFAFWLPIIIWWDARDKVAGLVIPGTIIITNGLILLYQNLTGDWDSWSYLWALEPLSVGLGLFLLYLLGNRAHGLLVASSIVASIGVFFLLIFGSIFGGLIRLLGPVALILVGLLLIANEFKRRNSRQYPQE